MVSYIVPVYNAANYLEPCVKSILACLETGDEIILIDDGSTDESDSICDRFGAAYECVTVEHLKNGGVSRARNRGIQLAKKEYIRFVDSDDMVLPANHSTEADLLIMDAEVTDGQSRLRRRVRMNSEKRFTPREILENLSSSDKQCLLHYLWNHLYKRKVILEHQIRFDESVTLGEDFLFNCAYLAHCATVEYQPVVCYRYFVRNSNSDNLTRKFHPDELARRRKIDKTFLELLGRTGCSDRAFQTAKRLIGEITVGSLESIATKGKDMSAQQIKAYMTGFYQTEYYDYLLGFVDSCSKRGKSEWLEHLLIHHKSCLGLYYYVRIRNTVRNRKMGKKS